MVVYKRSLEQQEKICRAYIENIGDYVESRYPQKADSIMHYVKNYFTAILESNSYRFNKTMGIDDIRDENKIKDKLDLEMQKLSKLRKTVKSKSNMIILESDYNRGIKSPKENINLLFKSIQNSSNNQNYKGKKQDKKNKIL